MKIRTISITVLAPRDAVYNFLADIENFPKWAGDYCEYIELRRSGWLAYTSEGEMIAELEADDVTGVIDIRLGVSEDKLGVFPLRVWRLSPQETVVSFTFVQSPRVPDESHEQQYQSWLINLQGFAWRFGGGEIHLPRADEQIRALGMN